MKKVFVSKVLAILLAVFCPMAANAQGLGAVFEYFDIALSANQEALDQAVAQRQDNFRLSIPTRAEIIMETELTGRPQDDEQYILKLVNLVESEGFGDNGDRSGLAAASRFIKTYTDSYAVYEAASGLRDLGISASEINNLAREISGLVLAGDTRNVDYLIQAGFVGKSAIEGFDGLTTFTDGSTDLIEQILSADNPSLIDEVIGLSALNASKEMGVFLSSDTTSARRIIAQEGVIQLLVNGTATGGSTIPISELRDQQIYALRSVSGRFGFGSKLEAFTNENVTIQSFQPVAVQVPASWSVEPDRSAEVVVNDPPAARNPRTDVVVVGTVAVDGSPIQSNTRSFESDLCRTGDCTSSMRDTLAEIQNRQETTTLDESNSGSLSPFDALKDNTRDNEFFVTENDEGEPVLRNNAGTHIEIQPTGPTGPTPEEIAAEEREEQERLAQEERDRLAEAERLAALRLQQIADLEAARDSLSLTQQDAQARLQERRNRLTFLQFNELEKVIEASGLVSGRIQELRIEQGATGLSASDQQLLLDLAAYEDRLQTEQDRITRDITTAQNAISQYETTLAQVETQLNTNAASLEGPDYIIASDYTVPNFTPEGLTDWTNYEYELPAFDPTELLTSELSNVVGYAVSVPVAGGTNRVTIDLVAEDNTILDRGIPGAITEIEDDNSDLLDRFTHLYFGNGVDENGDDSQWIYGEAATPEQFALRTGTATFNGGLSGYYAHGSVSDHTLYQDGVSGSLALEVDFGTNRLIGAGEIEIDTAVRNEALAFSLNESTISETDSGFTRSLDFSADATLENERGVSGNLGGTFYGEDASEAAGSFAFDLGTGFSAGLWAAGENFEGFTEDNYDGSFAIAYASVNNGTSTFSGDTPERQNGRIRISRKQDGTPILSDVTDTFSSDGYENVTWGSLRLDFSPTNAEIFNYSGNWVDVDGITSSTDLQDRSGSAQFGGEILGGYVASGGIEENALGIINLTANFGTQIVSGKFQFGHSCSGSGLNGCASASEIQSFNEVINDYNGSGFGNHGNRGLSGVIGVFGGDSAHEIGGYAWLTDVGSYVGVFRAREDLSFSEFVTPTTTGTHDPSDPPGTNYSNYRGLAAYNGYNFVSQDYVVGFVSVETVDPGYATPVLFENTFEGGDLTNSVDSIGRDYSYMNWGSWENADNTITEVDGQGLRGSDANWIVYDPTTNLRTTGQATYNGDAVGLTSASAGLSGNIQLTADFANDTITGNMTLDTSNGQSWADASFDTTIRRNTDSSGFQGALTGSDVNSGVIFGGFAGPDAEEVGGGWQIDNANGTNGVGIFRAQN